MYRIKRFLSRFFIPNSIMFIPHDCRKTLSIRLPSISIALPVLLCIVWLGGIFYVVSAAVSTNEYHRMKNELTFHTEQFMELNGTISSLKIELNGTISSLKKADNELRGLVSLGSREKILENVADSTSALQIDPIKEGLYDVGSIDMDLLRDQIKDATDRASKIKEFLTEQKDIYMATPRGWPVRGRITSPFGRRVHPVTGIREFHTAIDIGAPIGTPIKAVADGIVDFSGWSKYGGNVVAIEHGFNYRTAYLHNSKNLVVKGQKVKRGDIIAHVGNTGRTTGPHLSFEIRRNGRSVNPWSYMIAEDTKIVLKKEK